MGALGVGCADEVLPLAININFGPFSYHNMVNEANPEIFWSFLHILPLDQVAYEIKVGTDNNWDVAEIWSTGQVFSADTTVIYAGPALDDATLYHLRVRLYDGINWGSWKNAWFFTNFETVFMVPGDAATIQAGIDLANCLDTVLVAADTYVGEGNYDLDFDGKNIVLMSESGPDPTIIDCQGEENNKRRAFRLTSGEDSTSIIEGFTVTGGYGPSESGNYKGGALYCYAASPTVKNCIFEGNLGCDNGGAVATFGSSIMFIDCAFENNYAIHGGAVYFNGVIPVKSDTPSHPRMINCTFSNNNAQLGGGYGGAVYIQYGDLELTMEHCLIHDNSASVGGGIGCAASSGLDLLNCTLAGNSGSVGGGIWLEGGANAIIENSIIAFGPAGVAISGDASNILNILCTDIFGNVDGDWTDDIVQFTAINGNLSLDPMFCDSEAGDS